MPQVHPNLDEYRKNPQEGSSVDLVVGLGEMSKGELTDEVEELGGEYLRELGFEFHLVTVPETELEAVCELEGIDTVESDDGDDVEEFGKGKSGYHHVSNQ